MRRETRSAPPGVPETVGVVGRMARLGMAALLALTFLMAVSGAVNQAAAQVNPATPASTATQTSNTPSSSQGNTANPATGPGAPAVLASGLVYLSGDDVVWSVTELTLPDVADATPQTGDAAVLYQRSGASIARNDTTAKRAQVDTGTAYFVAAGDPYTISAIPGDKSLGWNFTIGASANVPTEAFYESPAISNISEGTYSESLTRYVLRADEEANVQPVTGSSLVMVVSGQVEISDGTSTSQLATADGQLVAKNSTVHNTGSSPAVYVVLGLGTAVSDDTAGSPLAPAATETPSGDTTAAPTEASSDTSSDTSGDTDAATATEAPSSGSDQPSGGPYLAVINITAESDIYLTVTVDGTTIFDGNLLSGQSTGTMTGSDFEVYTTVGGSTLFTDGCGSTFYMGYETGEANYTLTANADSCGP